MAVYTPLTRQDIESFLAQYDIGELVSFEGIAEGIENTNYFILTSPSPALAGEGRGGGKPLALSVGEGPLPNPPPLRGRGDTRYILTLFEKRVKIEDLPYFTALMQWWHGRGIHCPQPIQMKNGRVLSALKEKPALVVSFLEGSGVEKITAPHLLQLGKFMADMHIAGMDFPHSRVNTLSVAGWEAIIDDIGDRVDEIEPGLKALINETFNALSDHWPEALPGGPIHADLFPDNVFFHKTFGKPPVLSGVIDFYFACNDAWAYDLAICVNAWCFDERHRFIPERAQALMQSYTQARSLTPEEEAAFPLLLQGAALRFLLTRSYDWLNTPADALVNKKDPGEYIAKLQWWQKDNWIIG